MDSGTRDKLDQHLISARAKTFRAVNGGNVEIMRDWIRAYSGLSVASYNIFQPLTPDGLTDDELADAAAFYSMRETFYVVELVHDLFPDGPDFLDQRAYQALPPQLAMYLDGPHDPQNIRLNEKVIIEPVTNVPQLTGFCTLMHQVFDYSLEDMIKFFPVLHLGEDLRHVIHHYVAFMDEQPVGTGTLIYTDGVVSVWNVCTLDEYRRRGVGTTLVNRMLHDADQAGYSLKMLYSSPHAFSLFHRFDFEMYTQRQWFIPPGIEYQDW